MKKVLFFPGLGEKASDYKGILPKFIRVAKINWNTGKYAPRIDNYDTVVSFSLGTFFPLEYARKKKIKKLVLCSPTPFETMKGLKVGEVVFVVGQKEKFISENVRRIAKEVNTRVLIVKNGDHKIEDKYLKTVVSVLNSDING